MALPLGLAGKDVTGQARTGTGKTYAFGVTLLQRLSLTGLLPDTDDAHTDGPHGLVVTPTRELAIQVADDLETVGKSVSARVLTVFGGRAYEPQIQGLQAGADIVVGTPGRLLDLSDQGYLDLSRISVLVLDEADRMLDLGFLPDVERLLTLTPEERQTMLFSATMPAEVVTLSRRFLQRPTHVRAEHGDESSTVPDTTQHVYCTHPLDKPEVLARVLQAKDRGRSIIFCRTKRNADRLKSDLTERGFAAIAVHGDLGQGQRERSLRAFRDGTSDVLVATDVAARGLDVDDVTHVVNYACPEDEKEYLHRIGRTGRAGREGTAVTFVDWDDLARWSIINQALELSFSDPAETYSTSNHLFEELGIPPDATGRKAKPRARGQGQSTGHNRGARTARRPTRQRTRTRAGQPVERKTGDGAASTHADASPTPEQQGQPEHQGKQGNTATSGATSSRRRRRRSRQGRQRQQHQQQEQQGQQSGS